MRIHDYPSDVTDEQWARIEPLIPVHRGGRPRRIDVRDVLDGILYLLRTGCRWRCLPDNLPPRSTAWRYFDEWRSNGTLGRIQNALRPRDEAEGRLRLTRVSGIHGGRRRFVAGSKARCSRSTKCPRQGDSATSNINQWNKLCGRVVGRGVAMGRSACGTKRMRCERRRWSAVPRSRRAG